MRHQPYASALIDPGKKERFQQSAYQNGKVDGVKRVSKTFLKIDEKTAPKPKRARKKEQPAATVNLKKMMKPHAVFNQPP